MDEYREIAISQFKARCLAMIDEVARTGLPLIVTKRGKAIAKIVSLSRPEAQSLLGSVSYEREEDLTSPADEDWEADR
ncbi:MAG: type II toxin-antitoxin system Phd/YefM family antitoxin [Deltaproteobacteria bacterium]|nr:type II toxin-antitoxin system Phd/YefM family antitoxin [Deltaproteobacteria bacterium]